jgi:crotonobetainyl-CoA:carnitine CoA-transferase CaiB-like acyl-CoA transferase
MLSSLKMLDMIRVLAGLLCTMILGDMGADVIKSSVPASATRPAGGDHPSTRMERAPTS